MGELPVQTSLGAHIGLESQPSYDTPGNIRVKNGLNAIISSD